MTAVAEKELYITALHAKNVRSFRELNIVFNPRFNFITGPNGSGKTSVLRCLSMCVTYNELNDSRFGEGSEVWTDFTKDSKQYRVGTEAGWVETTSYRNIFQKSFNGPVEFQEGRETISTHDLFRRLPEYAPLFIGAFRKLNYEYINGMAREPEIEEKRNYYRTISPQSLNGTVTPNVKQWLINRYFITEKEWATYEKYNWGWLSSNLSSVAPENVNLEFAYIKQDLEPVFIINGNYCYLEELSAGFQSILSIIFSIIDWIEGTNEGDNKKVDTAIGTVIIDELDVHLHPEWQLSIRDTFERIFPKLQFIITTHSPHLIASAKPGEIISLSNNPEDLINIKPSERSYSGWNTDQILEEIMGVRGLENKEYAVMISKGLELVKKNNIELINEFIKEFEQIAHPEDSVLMAFKIKLAEMELKKGE